MSSRVRNVVVRVADSPRVRPVIERLVVPYAPTSAGVNLVVAEYYGMVVGLRFDDDAAAAKHYFGGGWRLGVVPNPFIDAPAARFKRAAAVLLRNALAVTATSSRARFPFPTSRYAVDAEQSGVVALTRAARSAPESVKVQLGNSTVSWQTYLERCGAVIPAARTVVENDLIDLDFYASQVGGARPISALAALDDYIANGELDGRAPNPFFEAEWYHSFERALLRRGRPANMLLDFVAAGERSQASPHFWGHRYLQRLDGDEPASLLGHFLRNAAGESSTPSVDGVPAIARADAEQLLRGRVADYHAGNAATVANGPILSRHPRSSARGAGRITADALIFVDERHISSSESVDALRALLRQRVDGLGIVLVEQDDTPRRPDTEELVAGSDQVEDIARSGVEDTFGAVVRRLVSERRPEAWAIWTPEQRWDDGLLAAGASALREHPEVGLAAIVAPTVPQPWLRTEDALWVAAGDGMGVVFSGRGERAIVPDAALDLGVAWRELIKLVAEGGSCAVVEAPLVRRIATADVDAFDARAGANAARSLFLAPFDAEPSAGVAVAIPTFEDWRMTLTAVRQVLATTPDDVVVQVVDNGSRRPVASILGAAFAGTDRVAVQRTALNTDFALGSNIAASAGARATTVFLNNDTAVLPGWLEPLVAALDDPGNAAAQPLLLYGDRTVQTAGTIFLGGMAMPRHLLADVHPIDVHPSLDEYRFSALTAACIALRYTDLRATGGFDPHYVNGMEDVDLCMRLDDRRALRVRTASHVVHYESRTPGRHAHHFENRRRFARRWRERLSTDLDDRSVLSQGQVRIEDVRWSRPEGSPLREPTVIYTRTDETPIRVEDGFPRLRWAIKTSATGDISGDSWGDTYFANSLAGALRELGQEAVIDRRTSHDRPSSTGWDDVTLSLRGLEGYLPQPGAINLLWIISHPDLVTRYELESGFQRIYAAGDPWARRISEHWGLDVRTLLQATDTRKFHPQAAGGAERDGVLFVGRTRGIARPIVLDTIAAGHEPAVFGDDGWEQFIDPRLVKAAVLPNDAVPAAYASASFVLNDHWADMAENGFFSNRLFDAAAAGARIVSDGVPGMAEVFGAQVQVYRDVEDLRRLLDPASEVWPGAEELAVLARRTAEQHSFDARARTMLQDVLELREGRG